MAKFEEKDRVAWEEIATVYGREIPIKLLGTILSVGTPYGNPELNLQYLVQPDLQNKNFLDESHLSFWVDEGRLVHAEPTDKPVEIGDFHALAERRGVNVEILIRDPEKYKKGYKAKLTKQDWGNSTIEIPDAVGDAVASGDEEAMEGFLKNTGYYEGWKATIYLDEVEKINDGT